MLNELDIARGRNELLITSDGQQYIDLITGFGAVLLGHSRRSILDRVREQLDDAWLIGRLHASICDEAAKLVVAGLKHQYQHQQFYSTGNEAVEFAIRMVTSLTGRKGLVGFERSMHGKSVAASSLCWQNDLFDLNNTCTLPFVDTCSESEILDRLKQTIVSGDIAAVFVELIQGSNGGYEASKEFYHAVSDLCQQHGVLFVVDEVLTGFYRSGHLSYSEALGLAPDIIIFGKAMGNGFPVSSVVSKPGLDVSSEMLPGSTFSNNPLVASAVSATLSEMQRLDMSALVETIHKAIRSEFSSFCETRVALRGNGALWILELPDTATALRVQADALSSGVILSANGKFIRLLPPATIEPENLSAALRTVREACTSALAK